jgi:anti-sigma B factor antagonist
MLHDVNALQGKVQNEKGAVFVWFEPFLKLHGTCTSGSFPDLEGRFMAEDREAGDALLVATHKTVALIDVKGRGSFKNGPALKQFAVSAMGEGCRDFVIDMAGCRGMDSTFMGVLAGVALRLRREGDGRVVMINLSAANKNLLQTLGLDRVLSIHEAGVSDAGLRQDLAVLTEVNVLDTAAVDEKFTLETMLTAHKDLVRTDAANFPKFQNVIEYLGKDLQKLGE